MPHHVVVEDEVEGEGGEDEVEADDAEEGEDAQREHLPRDVVAWPCGCG